MLVLPRLHRRDDENLRSSCSVSSPVSRTSCFATQLSVLQQTKEQENTYSTQAIGLGDQVVNLLTTLQHGLDGLVQRNLGLVQFLLAVVPISCDPASDIERVLTSS